MTIEIDGAGSNLPPLKPKKEPLIAVAEILAVDTVHLVTGDAPLRNLNAFYVDMLGMVVCPPGQASFAFRFAKLRVEFMRTSAAAIEASGGDLTRTGKLMILVKHFSSAMRVLSDLQIPCEETNFDMGLCRAMTLFDPAGNQVILLESRPM